MTPWYLSPVFLMTSLSAVSSAVLAAMQSGDSKIQWITAGVAALIAVVDSFTTTGKVGGSK